MMNIVIDTNVLVAGLLSPFGACGEIVRMVSAGELTLSFDARILSEYNEVLRRPRFGFDEEKIAALLDYIVYRGRAVAPPPFCLIHFLILMTNRSSKLPLRVKLHVLLQEIKNTFLQNNAKALKSFRQMRF